MMSLNREEFVKAVTNLEKKTPEILTPEASGEFEISLKKLEDEQFESLDEELDHSWIDNDPTAWMADNY
jgi:hypothetical protein|tara:strand:+ start:802 stop:1008 length:207 start_codon:yes stop_codon:yes gene_type:complete